MHCDRIISWRTSISRIQLLVLVVRVQWFNHSSSGSSSRSSSITSAFILQRPIPFRAPNENGRHGRCSSVVSLQLPSLNRLSALSSSSSTSSSTSSTSTSSQQSWISQAQEILSNLGESSDKIETTENDEVLIKKAELYLMNAVQEVNGAVMTNPAILSGFEDLFRIKISLNTKKILHKVDVDVDIINTIKLIIIQDRIGLASLLSDQGKYPDAANQLEEVMKMKDVLIEDDEAKQRQTLDKVSSMLFRTKANICDWNNYNESSSNLSQSTKNSLALASLEFKMKEEAVQEQVVNVQVPAVHPFEALAWPCITLKDSTSIAYTYAMRAIGSSSKQLVQQQQIAQQQQQAEWTQQQQQIGGMVSGSTLVQQQTTQQDLLDLIPWTNLNARFNSRSTTRTRTTNAVPPFVTVTTKRSNNNKKKMTQSSSSSTSTLSPSFSSYLSSLTSSSSILPSTTPTSDNKTKKIKVGYLSPDFTGKHPLAFLLQNVFQFHNTNNQDTDTDTDSNRDPTKFEIYLYSLDQENDNSLEVTKIINSRNNSNSHDDDGENNQNNWKVLTGSVSKMSNIILDDKLDILIDLCGYTGTSLIAEIMAYCRLQQLLSLSSNSSFSFSSSSSSTTTPDTTDDTTKNTDVSSTTNHNRMMIHVSYMGFPGSSGAPYIDYMIADKIVIPPSSSSLGESDESDNEEDEDEEGYNIRKYYTESILYMPHCYFVNSHRYIINNDNGNGNENGSGSSIENENNERHGQQSESKSRSSDGDNCRYNLYGLPSKGTGFVFCCHSRPDKIDPSTYKTWIQALKRTREEGRRINNSDMSNAVLWLLRSSSDSASTSTSSSNDNGQQQQQQQPQSSSSQCRMEMNLIRYARKIMNNDDDDNDDLDDVNNDDDNNDDDKYNTTTGKVVLIPDEQEQDQDHDQKQEQYLIFCNKVSRIEHLNRLSIGADLFLDTPAYNAHTVGCDCLSQGVPMISLLRNRNRNDNDNGVNDNDSKDNDSDNENDSNFIVPTDKLASRVGASLLKSAISNNNKSGPSSSSSSSSLSNKLIVSTMKEYEDTMVQCARENSNTDSNINTDSSSNFSSFRQQLLDNLHTAPLWDTKRWVQNLETGLTEMVNIRQQLKHKHEHFCDDDMDIYVVDENDDDDQLR